MFLRSAFVGVIRGFPFPMERTTDFLARIGRNPIVSRKGAKAPIRKECQHCQGFSDEDSSAETRDFCDFRGLASLREIFARCKASEHLPGG